MRQEAIYRRRRRVALGSAAAVAVVLAGAVVLVTADGDSDPAAAQVKTAPAPAAQPKPLPQLPGGGRRIFPDRRIVAFYGNPRAAQLGELGIGTPTRAGIKLVRQAKLYARKTRPVLPAMELIVTLATAAPGPGDLHRQRMPADMIRTYLKAARRAGALLILDIQPGRADFPGEIEHLRRWLREPDVGLALDPEWHVGPGETPGKVIGRMDAATVNRAAATLSAIVKKYKLPEKLLIVHRFTDTMITNDEQLEHAPGVQVVVNVDGFGTQSAKIGKYKAFAQRTPQVRRGFKLFYHEDTNMLKPAQVMALKPRPDVIVYE